MSDPKNEKMETARGVVTEALPNTVFRVTLEERSLADAKASAGKDEEREILAYLGGKMRMHRIKVLIGDKVEVVLDPYGGKGRIVKRL